MKILVIGAGAIGGYVGGLLALAGHEVVFAVRARSAEVLTRQGLRLSGPRGVWHIPTVRAVYDPALDLGNVDLALSCVKLYDAESSARQWARQLQTSQAIISLQNGVDGQHRVAAGCGVARVYGGLAYIAGKQAAPGEIHYLSDMSSIVYGGPGALLDVVLTQFQACVQEMHQRTPFEAVRVEDIVSAQWQKFTLLATNAALTSLTRCPAGVVYHDEDLLDLARQSIAEVMAVGIACGAHFPSDHAGHTIALLQGFPAELYASMHHDLAAGKPLELDGISATVVRLGRDHGIPTPFHTMAYACLKPYKDGKPFPLPCVGEGARRAGEGVVT